MSEMIQTVNSVGRAFWEYAGSMLLQTGFLIAVLLCADFFLSRRIRATLRYWIWMLVFVKLLLPPSLCVPTGIGYWLGGQTPAAASPGTMENIRSPVTLETSAAMEKPVAQPAHFVPAVVEPTKSIATRLEPLTWQGGIFGLWVGGVLVFAGLVIQRWRFVRGLLARGEPAPDDLVDVLDRCRRRMSVRGRVGLRLSPDAFSPAVCGLLNPTILVPRALLDRLSPEGLKAVLIHELAHVKRGDLWINSLQTVLQVAYFYNPLVWLANAIVRRVREQAVDEMVLVALGAEARSYGNTLIDIAEMAFLRVSPALRLIGVAESRKSLEGRIKHMMTRPMPKNAKVGFWGLLAVLAVGAVLLPMAQAQKTNGNAVPSGEPRVFAAPQRPPEPAADRKQSAERLSALGEATLVFSVDHDRSLPERIEDLPDDPGLAKSWLLENVVYFGKGKKTYNEPDSLVAYDKTLLRRGHGTNVLYLDTRVVFETPERLESLGITSSIEPRVESQLQLLKLGRALVLFANTRSGRFPARLEELPDTVGIVDLPWLQKHVTYVGAGLSLRYDVGRVLAFDRSLLQTGEGTNVLYQDSHIEFETLETLRQLGIMVTDSAASSPGEAFRSYEVNRIVADFPAGEDLSAPEAAYATINRIDRDDPSAWKRVSVARLADRFGPDSDRKKTADPEWTKVIHNARIREVLVWNMTKAAVIAELPQESFGKKIVDPFDVRFLQLENGRWLNAGNGRFASSEAAKTHFMNWMQRETSQADAMRDPLQHADEIKQAAARLFEKLRTADFGELLSYYREGKWEADGWKKFPTYGLYMVHTDYPSFALWCCTHFKDNPIADIQLGDVFIGDALVLDKTGWPTVPYKLTLQDGTVLAGNLPFRYIIDRGKGHWHGMEGIDWHLWPDGTK